jgi:hypothetical protein
MSLKEDDLSRCSDDLDVQLPSDLSVLGVVVKTKEPSVTKEVTDWRLLYSKDDPILFIERFIREEAFS